MKDPMRKPKPIICKHGSFIWPWAAKAPGWIQEVICRYCGK